MFDFIGDIHGFADKLTQLLTKMGYTKKNGAYHHPERKVLFIGDYIDRGKQISETLEIVKSMQEAGNAIALMGNHEYNAICFHYPETTGGHLRKHEIKNILQHCETLNQFKNRQKEYEEYLDWFLTLPLFYETDQFRAVHACWDPANISIIQEQHLTDNRLTPEAVYASVAEGTPFNLAIEETLKGKEMRMPDGLSFADKGGHYRTDIRIKWWEDPTKANYQQISVEPLENLPATLLDLSQFKNMDYYGAMEKPVFFGHYWLKGSPSIYRNNICCLDYSVAKDGYLTAYRFDGEKQLRNDKLVYV
jgi:hypothetical protein